MRGILCLEDWSGRIQIELTHRHCSPHSASLVLLCNILPGLIIKLLYPFIANWVPYGYVIHPSSLQTSVQCSTGIGVLPPRGIPPHPGSRRLCPPGPLWRPHRFSSVGIGRKHLPRTVQPLYKVSSFLLCSYFLLTDIQSECIPRVQGWPV